MLLPILFFVPLMFYLFPGADGRHRWSEQFADACRFLLCGSLHSSFGDQEGKIQVAWILLLAMCEFIALLLWLLRHSLVPRAAPSDFYGSLDFPDGLALLGGEAG